MAEELNGVIIVNKHKGVTSHDIVFKIRKLFGTKKVGHTGTLDPMAEGVLPVWVRMSLTNKRNASTITATNKSASASEKRA